MVRVVKAFIVVLLYSAVSIGAPANDDLIGSARIKVSCDCFRDVKVDSVFAIVVDDTSAFLVGEKKGKIEWKRPIPIGEINIAKTTIDCCEDGKTVVFSSQAPFSAYESVQKFTFDGKKFVDAGSDSRDPSAETVATAIALAEAGDAAKLDTFNCEIIYPDRYVNGPVIAEALAKGHAAALALYKNKQPGKAAARMKLMFKTAYNISAQVADGNETAAMSDMEKYLGRCKAAGTEKNAYLAPLNDYGFFLQEAGDHKAAIDLFRLVIKEDPARAVAYLNLGDSYWSLKDTAHAKEAYGTYAVLMKKLNKEAGMPRRVRERM
jgi:hypothetical protein